MSGQICIESVTNRIEKDNSPPFRVEKRKSSNSDIDLLQNLLLSSGDDFFTEGGPVETHSEHINNILDNDFTWGLSRKIGIPIIKKFLEKKTEKIEHLVDTLDNLTEQGNWEAVSILRRRGLTQKSSKNMLNLMVELANEYLDDGERTFPYIE